MMCGAITAPANAPEPNTASMCSESRSAPDSTGVTIWSCGRATSAIARQTSRASEASAGLPRRTRRGSFVPLPQPLEAVGHGVNPRGDAEGDVPGRPRVNLPLGYPPGVLYGAGSGSRGRLEVLASEVSEEPVPVGAAFGPAPFRAETCSSTASTSA